MYISIYVQTFWQIGEMDEIEEESDPREQLFHNNVREQIVSVFRLDFYW